MTREKILSLRALQELDLKIHRLRRILERTPAELLESQQQVAQARAAVAAAGEKIKELKLEGARQELKIKSFDDEIARYEQQVRLVRKNDEYQVLMKEISSKKADKSVVEDGLLEVWTMAEHEERLKQQREGELVEAEGRERAARRRHEEEVARVGRELEEHLARRGTLKPSLDEDLVALYERTQVAKEDGRGLAPLVAVAADDSREPDSFVCGGCSVNITLQDANQIYTGREPFLCRNCARLLYVESAAG
jgi:predicted  nucleic acid-binding Zn-ribbon protein